MAALPSPSFASTVALTLGLAVSCWAKTVCPAALSQPGAIFSATSVMPWLFVFPAVRGVVLSPQIELL